MVSSQWRWMTVLGGPFQLLSSLHPSNRILGQMGAEMDSQEQAGDEHPILSFLTLFMLHSGAGYYKLYK
jgi:hypothetical protein